MNNSFLIRVCIVYINHKMVVGFLVFVVVYIDLEIQLDFKRIGHQQMLLEIIPLDDLF